LPPHSTFTAGSLASIASILSWANDLFAGQLTAQAFLTKDGKRLLLINQRNRNITITLPPDLTGSSYAVVNEKSGEDPPINGTIQGNTLALEPFAVAVVAGKQ